IAIAMASPIVRASALVDRLPVWFQWYLRPAGEQTTFTLMPWAGFVFAGAACGAVLVEAHAAGTARRLHGALAASGAALVAIGFLTAARPSIYASSSLWTTAAAFVAFSSLMYGAVVLRDRVLTLRRPRRSGAVTHAAPA